MIYKCPTCRKPVMRMSENKWRPFCSERCKLIDLGAWIDGGNRIPAEEGMIGSLEQNTPPVKH